VPITFEKLVSLVRERAECELTPAVARSGDAAERAVVERFVLFTLDALDLHVSKKPDEHGNHEIYSPQPRPASYPASQNAHWLGGRRR
jgi:hypothetical protein